MNANPEGDLAWFIPVAIGLVGGGLNVASNWGNISNLAEGLTYFTTGAVGYNVATVNPIAGAAILSGGNLATKGINGDLHLNSFSDFAQVGLETGLDFVTTYTGGKAFQQWSSFNPATRLTKGEVTELAKQGIHPSTTAVGGTGLRKTTVETLASVTTQSTKKALNNSLKSAAQIDELGKFLSKNYLDDIGDDLVKNGWTKFGEKGSRTNFIKHVDNKRYILEWNRAGIDHAVKSNTQYWKLYADKMSNQKVLFRASPTDNFNPGGYGETFINGIKF